MKILFMYCDTFSYHPAVKNEGGLEEHTEGAFFEKVQLAFIQVEEYDEAREDQKALERKFLNYIKWILRKNETNKVVLHSFAHLSDSKASASYTKSLLDKVEARLKNVNYDATQTPFGYFLDLNINAPGFSLARVFRSF